MSTTETPSKSRIIKEIIFFTCSLVGYTIFYFTLAFLLNKEFSQQSFFETMIVVILVCYLLRFVFIVMKNLK